VSSLQDRYREQPSISPATLDLHEIQATVLRYRPEPYYGTHILLHIEDAPSGREFLRRLAPHVASAADWWKAVPVKCTIWAASMSTRCRSLASAMAA